ncbi:hypothetical protein DUI87_00697 [Hirundo rustica rustica]|uniref:Uncharacterized protein n=1 Tax=Hirundo rustica rustica TaxID=333673 RepID=A0A3M0LAN2_HIRRU|nr:hypothetical protein DUI87_00697 [Hirundo rustica rustica]
MRRHCKLQDPFPRVLKKSFDINLSSPLTRFVGTGIGPCIDHFVSKFSKAVKFVLNKVWYLGYREDYPTVQLCKGLVLIADDYSDPFDAKSELNRMGKGENTGYMEPYEAQRIMAAVHIDIALPGISAFQKELAPVLRLHETFAIKCQIKAVYTTVFCAAS